MLTKTHQTHRSAAPVMVSLLAALSACFWGAQALAMDTLDSSEHEAQTESASGFHPMGGSSDILKVKAEDAAIVALSGNALLELRLESKIHDILWQGVMDGTYEYLCIDGYCFFLDFSPVDNQLYAFDWLGLQYLVRRKASLATSTTGR